MADQSKFLDYPGLSRFYNNLKGRYATKNDLKNIDADTITTTALTVSGYANIEQLVVPHLYSNDQHTEYIDAAKADITYATITNLTATNEAVSNLTARTVTVEGNLTAAQADITDLKAADVNITGRLDAAEGNITTLTADNATINQKLTAAEADITSLTADYATINGKLTAAVGDISYIQSNYAKSDISNVNTSWITNGIIKNGAITDAMIGSLSANKLTAGTINGSVINVTNLNADNITAGTLNGQRIGEGTLSLDKLSEDVYTESEVDAKLSTMQAEIDGAIETYTGTDIPTLNNTPASSWTTNDEKAKHVGDVYYVVNAGNQADGYCYRFANTGTTANPSYGWILIKDSDVTAALQRLIDAEGDIDGLQSFESTTSSWITETDEELSSLKTNHTSLVAVVDKTLVSTTQLWFTKADTTAPNKPTTHVTSTSTAGNAWRTVVPAYNSSYPNYFYCYEWKYADGTYGWSDVTRDIGMGETQSTARTASSNASTALTNAATAQSAAEGAQSTANTAVSNAETAQNTANANIKSTVQLWFTKADTTAPSKPTAHVTTNDASTANAWNIAVPTYNATYPNYFYCYEYQKGDDTYSWSDVVLDRATTENQANARSALSQVATKVETSTFNEVKQTVDTNSASITTLSETVETKANSDDVYTKTKTDELLNDKAAVSTVTTLSTTVNDVQQTATSNSSKISNLTTRLGTNADGTQKSTDIVSKYSDLSQSLDTFKSTVSSTYATQANLNAEINQRKAMYGTSSTAAGTTAKVVTCANFVLYTGARVAVTFSNANTATVPTLNVNSTGAKTIKSFSGADLTEAEYKWAAGSTLEFIYDGTNWRLADEGTLKRLNAAEGTLSIHTTSIEQNTNAIALKANAADVYTKTQTDGLITTEVNNRNAAITASADAINLSVSQTYTTKTEFDNLEIGGRNLLSDTRAFGAVNTTGWPLIVGAALLTAETYKDLTVREYPSTTLSSGTKALVEYILSASKATDVIQLGATYVCSFYAKGSGSFRTYFYQNNPAVASWIASDGTTGTSTDGAKLWTLTDEWEKYWIAYTLSSTGTPGIKRLLFRHDYNASETLSVKLCGLKLEKGNKATDWSPAPEDLEAYTDSAVSIAKADIKVTTDGISSEVSKISSVKYVNSTTSSWTLANIKTYAEEGHTEVWNVTSTADLRVGDTVYVKGTDSTRSCTVYIKTTVTSVDTTTRFTGTSHGYEDVLPVETIKSTINQSADSVKIAAKHVDIEGATIFSSGGRLSADSLNNAISTAVDNIEIGGRNLALATPLSEETASYNAYKINTTASLAELGEGTQLTLQLWGVELDSNSGGIWPYWGGGTINPFGTYKPDVNGYVCAKITISAAHASHADGAKKMIYLYNSVNGHSDMNLKVDHWKLEKGNKPTDWTPAPEDIVGQAVDNVEVGGRNLLLNSGTMPLQVTSSTPPIYGWRASGGGTVSHIDISTPPIAGISGGIRCTNTGSSAATIGIAQDSLTNRFIIGKKYSMGYWIRASDEFSSTVRVQPIWGASGQAADIKQISMTLNTSWQYVSGEGLVLNGEQRSTYSGGYVYATGVPAGGYIEVCGIMLEEGNKCTSWSPAPEDLNVQEQRIYYKTTSTTAPTAPTTWVAETGTAALTWTTKRMPYDQINKYLYTCTQRQAVGGGITNSTVLLDDTTTVIDGGNIIAGTVTANKLNASDINASKTLTVGALTDAAQSQVLNSEIEVGGRNLLGGTANKTSPTLVTSSANNTFGSIGGYNTPPSNISIEEYDDSSYALIATETATGNRGAAWYTKPGVLAYGDTVTFSCRVKASLSTSVHTHTAWRNASATAAYTGWTAGGSKTIEADTWTDYSYTFTCASAYPDGEFLVALCFDGNSSGLTWKIAHAKLEKGNKPTDWTPAPEDVDSAIETVNATAQSNYEALNSRGIQLISNGDGSLGNKTNFSGSNWVFDGEVNNNSTGSFKRSGNAPFTNFVDVSIDEYIPIDTSKEYSMQMDARCSGEYGARMYAGLRCYDADKNEIYSSHCFYHKGSTTTLAQELKNGDTVIYLTDASGWSDESASHRRGIIIWDYTNSFGYTYPKETYSRHSYSNLWTYNASAIDTTTNTITLSSPWNKGTVPSGTYLSQCTSGSTFQYFLTNTAVTSTWVTYKGIYTGIGDIANGAWVMPGTQFRPATVYVKFSVLLNYGASSSNPQDQTWITNVSLKENVATGSELAEVNANAENAKKTATSYIVANSTGLMVANMIGSEGQTTPSTATTRNVFITNNDVQIRNGQTVLASYGDSITIGNDSNYKITLDTTNGLKIGSSVQITTSGNAYFNGTIYASNGTIGGWTIGEASLYSTSSAGKITGLQNQNNGTWAIAVAATTMADWSTAPFRVRHDGYMVSTSGTIGGWNIGSTYIDSTDSSKSTYVLLKNGVYNSSTNPNQDVFVVRNGASGSYTYPFLLRATGEFSVGGGKLYYNPTTSTLSVNGAVTATTGKIGVFNLNNALYTSSNSFGTVANNIYIGSSGISLGTTFRVTSGGAMRATNGEIGGFAIGETNLTGSVTNSNGTVTSIKLDIANAILKVANGDDNTQLLGATFAVVKSGTGSFQATGPTIECSFNSVSGTAFKVASSAVSLGIPLVSSTNISATGYITSSNYISTSGTITAGSEIRSNATKSDGGNFRAISGNYGTILRNDSSNFYILLTDSGNATGTWNSLRPLTISLSGGGVSSGTNWDIYSSANKTFNIRSTGGTADLNITTASSHEARVTVNNGVHAGKFQSSSGNNLGIYDNTNSKWVVYSNSSGTVTVNTSDRRAKNYIQDTTQDSAIDLLRSIKIRQFTYKDDEHGVVTNGIFAQDIRDYLISKNMGYRSYLNIQGANGDEEIYYDLTMDEDKVQYGLEYHKLVPELWLGWQYHDTEIDKLKKRITTLELLLVKNDITFD